MAAKQTRFNLTDGRFLLLDNRLVVVLDSDYAEAILEQVRFVETQYSSEAALRFLVALGEKLQGKILKPDDATTLIFSIQADTKEKKEALGSLTLCSKCKRKYRDLNRPENIKCPLCYPAPTAVLSAKQGV